MSWFNLKQFGLSALAILILFTAKQLVSSVDLSSDAAAVDVTETENTGETVVTEFTPTDFSGVYSRFEEIQPTEKKEEQPSAEELAAQNNKNKNKKVKKLRPNFVNFDSDHQVGLVSIFRQPERFAVLQLINFETGKTEFLKIKEGQSHKGFFVKEISELTVLLESQDSKLKLALFNAKKTA